MRATYSPGARREECASFKFAETAAETEPVCLVLSHLGKSLLHTIICAYIPWRMCAHILFILHVDAVSSHIPAAGLVHTFSVTQFSTLLKELVFHTCVLFPPVSTVRLIVLTCFAV